MFQPSNETPGETKERSLYVPACQANYIALLDAASSVIGNVVMKKIAISVGAVFILAAAPSSELARPAARAHHSLVYDPETRRILLYGGSTPSGATHRYFGDVWSWDGARWTRIGDTGKPSSSTRMIYDPIKGAILSVGGVRDGENLGSLGMLRGGELTLLSTRKELALSEAAVTGDRARGTILLHGGARSDGTISDETWQFRKARWTQIRADRAGAGPGPLQSASMTYDPVRRVIILFGGVDDKRMMSGRTWEWNGVNWRELRVPGPSARMGAAFAYDAARKTAVLFGGVTSDFKSSGETWLWDGRSWAKAVGPGPQARSLAAMAYDNKRKRIVLFGGRLKYPVDTSDTWEWNGKGWRLVETGPQG